MGRIKKTKEVELETQETETKIVADVLVLDEQQKEKVLVQEIVKEVPCKLSEEQVDAVKQAIKYLKMLYRSTNTISLRLEIQKAFTDLSSLLDD